MSQCAYLANHADLAAHLFYVANLESGGWGARRGRDRAVVISFKTRRSTLERGSCDVNVGAANQKQKSQPIKNRKLAASRCDLGGWLRLQSVDELSWFHRRTRQNCDWSHTIVLQKAKTLLERALLERNRPEKVRVKMRNLDGGHFAKQVERGFLRKSYIDGLRRDKWVEDEILVYSR